MISLTHIPENLGLAFSLPVQKDASRVRPCNNLCPVPQELDKEFGRLLDALRELPNNVEARTVVVFASDHGEMLESHELTGKGHW